MFFSADAGTVAMSGPCVPEPPIETSAALCRRLPLTKTKVLSVGNPRRDAGRIIVAPSEIG